METVAPEPVTTPCLLLSRVAECSAARAGAAFHNAVEVFYLQIPGEGAH